MDSSRADLALLFRRAGFGATTSELDEAESAGFDATVDRLVNGLQEPDGSDPPVHAPKLSTYREIQNGMGANTYEQYVTMIGWWLDKMAATTTPLREKLTLLMHGQFPTGFSKVGIPIFMYHQNEIFRNLGPGAFDDLTLAVSKDPAMLIWLDTGTDVRNAPNENFARALMERFTMGIGNYTQRDVEEGARAFTGWSISKSGRFALNEGEHDFGEKVYLGHHGDLSGDDVIRIATRTSASARWVTARMWSWLAYPVGTQASVVSDLAPGYASDLNMTNLVRAILSHPDFRSPSAQSGLVKQPIEWVAGIMRAFRLRTSSFKKYGGAGYLQWVLGNLGQTPFDPPSVGGWGANQYWLSTASSLAQLNFAQTVAQVADLSPIDNVAGPDRVEALGSMLTLDSWTSASRSELGRAHHDLPMLVTLALTAPEVVAN